MGGKKRPCHIEWRGWSLKLEFQHMVNWWRIRSYNEVNIEKGHDSINIQTPQEIAVDSQ